MLKKKLLPSVTLLLVLALMLLTACTQTRETQEPEQTPEPEKEGPYQPQWYSESPFQSDSSGYASTATAVSYDSASAAEAARQQSLEFLKQGVAEAMEEKRVELQNEEGNAFAGYKEFIVMLRQAESNIPEYAKVAEMEVIQEPDSEGIYRGFAQVKMNNQQLLSWLDDSFAANQGYLSSFKKHFE